MKEPRKWFEAYNQAVYYSSDKGGRFLEDINDAVIRCRPNKVGCWFLFNKKNNEQLWKSDYRNEYGYYDPKIHTLEMPFDEFNMVKDLENVTLTKEQEDKIFNYVTRGHHCNYLSKSYDLVIHFLKQNMYHCNSCGIHYGNTYFDYSKCLRRLLDDMGFKYKIVTHIERQDVMIFLTNPINSQHLLDRISAKFIGGEDIDKES